MALVASDKQVECDGITAQQGEVFVSGEANRYQFVSNQANLEKVAEAIRKATTIKIGMPQSRQQEKITLCLSDKSTIALLKSVFKTNYVLIFNDAKELVEASILQKGTGENKNLPKMARFNGKVVVKGNVAAVFHMPATENPHDVERYVLSRHQLLDELADAYPEKPIDTQISFSRALTKAQLLNVLGNDALGVSSLNTINGEYVGGNDLKSGMTLQEAVNKIDKDETEFLEVHCIEENMGNSAKFSAECEKMQNAHMNKGVMFYGAVLTSTTTKLKALKDKEKEVKLVDPMWSGDVGNELSSCTCP